MKISDAFHRWKAQRIAVNTSYPNLEDAFYAGAAVMAEILAERLALSFREQLVLTILKGHFDTKQTLTDKKLIEIADTIMALMQDEK